MHTDPTKPLKREPEPTKPTGQAQPTREALQRIRRILSKDAAAHARSVAHSVGVCAA